MPFSCSLFKICSNTNCLVNSTSLFWAAPNFKASVANPASSNALPAAFVAFITSITVDVAPKAVFSPLNELINIGTVIVADITVWVILSPKDVCSSFQVWIREFTELQAIVNPDNAEVIVETFCIILPVFCSNSTLSWKSTSICPSWFLIASAFCLAFISSSTAFAFLSEVPNAAFSSASIFSTILSILSFSLLVNSFKSLSFVKASIWLLYFPLSLVIIISIWLTYSKHSSSSATFFSVQLNILFSSLLIVWVVSNESCCFISNNPHSLEISKYSTSSLFNWDCSLKNSFLSKTSLELAVAFFSIRTASCSNCPICCCIAVSSLYFSVEIDFCSLSISAAYFNWVS